MAAVRLTEEVERVLLSSPEADPRYDRDLGIAIARVEGGDPRPPSVAGLGPDPALRVGSPSTTSERA